MEIVKKKIIKKYQEFIWFNNICLSLRAELQSIHYNQIEITNTMETIKTQATILKDSYILHNNITANNMSLTKSPCFDVVEPMMEYQN